MNAESIKMFDSNPVWCYYHNWSFDQADLYGYSWAGGLASHIIKQTMEMDGKTYFVLSYGESQFSARQQTRKATGNDISTNSVRIREEDGKIYVVYKDYLAMTDRWSNHYEFDKDYIPYELTDDGELVLYDFTMQVGDKFRSVEGYDDISVSDIGEITDRKGVVRKLFTLSNGCKVVEGVGCITPGRMLLNYLNPSREKKNWSEKVYTCLWTYGENDGQGFFADRQFTMTRNEIQAAEAELTGVPINEYTDPKTNVVYAYDDRTGTARVKRGRSTEYINLDEETLPIPGSPEASGELIILDHITVNGSEYKVTSVGKCAFVNCKGITSVVIPETVTNIEEEALVSCESMESLILPRHIASFGRAAFSNCPSLNTIVSLSEDPVLCINAFELNMSNPSAIYDNATLYVPSGCKEKYEGLADWNRFKRIKEFDVTSIHVPSSVSPSNSSSPLFDLSGRRLSSVPWKGVYIKDGKKVEESRGQVFDSSCNK